MWAVVARCLLCVFAASLAAAPQLSHRAFGDDHITAGAGHEASAAIVAGDPVARALASAEPSAVPLRLRPCHGAWALSASREATSPDGAVTGANHKLTPRIALRRRRIPPPNEDGASSVG